MVKFLSGIKNKNDRINLKSNNIGAVNGTFHHNNSDRLSHCRRHQSRRTNRRKSWGYFMEKSNQLLAFIRQKLPNTAQKIENADEQSLDYQQTIPEIASLAENNAEIKQLIEEIANLSKTQSLPNTFNQNIEKAVNAAQTINQQGSTFNINF